MQVTTLVTTFGSIAIAILAVVVGMVGYSIKLSLAAMRATQDAMRANQEALEAHRQGVDKALAGIRTEMATFRSSVDTSFAGIRTEITTFRSSVDTSLEGIRTEITTLRTEMTEMRVELKQEIGKVDGKVEYLTRRVDALQSDVSYIRGRLFLSDEELPEGSKAPRTPGPAAQPPVSGSVPTSVPVRR